MTSLGHTSVTSDDSDSHKSHDAEKGVKDSERNDVIQCVIYMLTLRHTHGHLE